MEGHHPNNVPSEDALSTHYLAAALDTLSAREVGLLGP
jgi:hypothetical protein